MALARRASRSGHISKAPSKEIPQYDAKYLPEPLKRPASQLPLLKQLKVNENQPPPTKDKIDRVAIWLHSVENTTPSRKAKRVPPTPHSLRIEPIKMSVLAAKVQQVLSGDSIVLANQANPQQTRTLSLAFVSAPRLRREGDEPFAFESRELLRKSLVGQTVKFKVLYKIPTTGREYGIVHVGDTPIADYALQEGWVKLREDAGKKEENPELLSMLERFRALEAQAKAEDKGLWGSSKGSVRCEYDVKDVKSFVEQHKGQELNGIVEKVITGDRLIARVFLDDTSHMQLLLLLAGIRAPATKRTLTSGDEQPGEPFAEEAHQFVEYRLLQRNVKIIPLGVSPQGQLVATVAHPKMGNIAPFLLDAGFARCTDFHSTLLGSEMGKLRAAEQKAKQTGAGQFKGHVAPQRGAQGGEQEYTVSRIISADTIMVRTKTGQEKRISLSSTRQPKPSDPKQSPWGAEAREFVRKRAIGKHVRVTIDGKRAATEGYEEREVATVTLANKNLASSIVEAGYASVIRHRQDDTDRSPIYDELLQAEQEAQAEKRGMWSEKGPAAKTFVDYSESLEKAKRMLSTLSRQKKVPAVVDFVKSGSRFTVLVPRENAKLTFVISGIRAPRTARNASEKSEPYGQEAAEFANRRCQQRDVEIDVEDTDKVGGFIGTMYINRENFAKLLLEEGLASVHAYSAEKTGNANELFAAEQKAKDARKGIWTDYDPSQDEEAEEANGSGAHSATNGTAINGEAAAPRKNDWRDVVVTYVDPETARMKVQSIGTGTTGRLEETMKAFRSLHLGSSSSSKSLDGPPKTGEYVAAKFSEDGQWYRARVRRNDREAKKAEVVYIDYGNSEFIPWSELRAIGEKYTPSNSANLKAQAVDVALSWCQFPPSGDYLKDAVAYLNDSLEGRPMKARVDAQDRDGLLWVSLFDSQSDPYDRSVNADAVAEGHALVPRKLKAWERGGNEELGLLKKLQSEASDSHRGMWEFGDPTGAED